MRLLYFILSFHLVCLTIPSHLLAESFPKVIKKIKPSVVAIGTFYIKQKPRAQYYGSGFIIRSDGLIATANHVVQAIQTKLHEDYLRVFIPSQNDPKGIPAKVVAQSKQFDLALLQCDAKDLPFLKIESSTSYKEGEEVAFCGYPYGLMLGLYPTTHRGIISSISPHILPVISARQLTPEMVKALTTKFNIFHLDAVIYPGHSGGPLFNPHSGKVIGVVTSGLFTKEAKTKFRLPTGISYAIPIEHLESVIASLEKTKKTAPAQKK